MCVLVKFILVKGIDRGYQIGLNPMPVLIIKFGCMFYATCCVSYQCFCSLDRNFDISGFNQYINFIGLIQLYDVSTWFNMVDDLQD